jgi:hypothetical protein
MAYVRTVHCLSVIDQHYALSYITPLFDTQAPTCFGIHVPSSRRHKKLPEDGKLMPKHVGPCVSKKE